MTQPSSKEDSSSDYANRLQSAASSERRTKIFEEVTATIAAGDPGACRAIILQARLSFSNPSKPDVEQRAAMRAYAAALKRSPESESILPKDLNALLEIEANSSYGDVKNEARQALLAILNASPVMVEEYYDQKRSQLDNASNLENTKQLKTVVGILDEIQPEFAFRDAAHETTKKPPAKSLKALGTLGPLLSARPRQRTPQFLQNIGHTTHNSLSKVTQGRPLGITPLLANAALPVAVAVDLATLIPRMAASDIKQTYRGSKSVLTGTAKAAIVGATHAGIWSQYKKFTGDESILNNRTFIQLVDGTPPAPSSVAINAIGIGCMGIVAALGLSLTMTMLVDDRFSGKLKERVYAHRKLSSLTAQEIDRRSMLLTPLTRTVLRIKKSWQDRHNTP